MIDENDINTLKEVFLTRKECEARNAQTSSHVADLKADIQECRTKLNMLIGILAAIAVPVLSIAIKLLFGGM